MRKDEFFYRVKFPNSDRPDFETAFLSHVFRLLHYIHKSEVAVVYEVSKLTDEEFEIYFSPNESFEILDSFSKMLKSNLYHE